MRLLLIVLVSLSLCLPVTAQPANLAADSQRARDLLAAKRYAEAVPLLEKLLQAMPANTALRLNLAVAMHLSGQDTRAIPHFETVLKEQPNALPALMLLGASYMRTGNPAKAAPVLEKALTLAPAENEGRQMLIDALLMLGRYDAAVPHFRKLAAASPGDAAPIYGLGRCYESIAQRAFDELAKLGMDSAYWLMLAADARLSLGRNTAAFSLYRAALDKQPRFRGAHAGLAEVYRRTGHADWAAIEEQEEAKIPPLDCTEPSSECLFLKGQFERALSTALRSKTRAALYLQARAANELARAAFAKLAALPPSLQSHRFKAEMYRNQGRHDDSVREWKAALALSPRDPVLQQELVVSVYMENDFASAERMARDLLASQPDAPELNFILGGSLLNLQRPEEAIKPLEAAVRAQGDNLSARASLGRALQMVGRSREAIPHLEAALPSDKDGSLHFQLSRALQDAGQPERAAGMLQKYQEITRSKPEEEAVISAPRR